MTKDINKERNLKKKNTVVVTIKTHKDNKGGHPHIIVDNVDDKHVSVGLTHDKYKGKNRTNYALEANPLGGSEQSYMHRQGTVDSKRSYRGERSGRMTEKDYNKAKEYGEKAKRKHLEKKRKKSNDRPCNYASSRT